MSSRDYISPEYERPNYETAEEYNRARREREAKMAEEQKLYDEEGNYNYSYNYNSNSNSYSCYETPRNNSAGFKIVLSVIMIALFMVICGTVFVIMRSEIGYIAEENIWDNLFHDFEDYEDYDEEIEWLKERTTPLPEGYSKFIWKGSEYAVPISYDSFLKTGFVLEGFSTKTKLEPGQLESYSFSMDDDYYGSVCFTNYGEKTLKITECTVDYIWFFHDEDSSPDITFFDGLSWDCSLEDMNGFLGEPQYISTQTFENGDVYKSVTWDYYGDGISQGVVVCFYNDNMCSIAFEFYNK